MLGIALLFVGIVLVHNGVLFMSTSKIIKKESDGKEIELTVPLVVASPKTIAFFNVVVGSLLVLANFLLLAHHAPLDLIASGLPRYVIFQNIAAGFVFGFTYLFIAGNLLLKLDSRPFGLFCFGASIFAFVMVIYNFVQLADFGMENGYSFLILALLWITWFVLWFAGVMQFTFKMKIMEKVFPYISISVGIVGAFIPAIALLTGVWGLL